MKKLFFGFLLFSSVCFCDEAPSYSLHACQAKALERNQLVSIAGLQMNVAREKINEIEGINTPKLSAEGLYTIRDKHPGSIRKAPVQQKPAASPPGLQQKEHRPSTIKTIVGHKKVATSKVSLIVPICDFGYVDRLVGAQKSRVEERESEAKRTEQDLLLAVARSYYTALESKHIELVVLQSIKLLSQQLAVAKDHYAVGLVTKNDVLGVEVQLASRRQELIQVQHTMEQAIAALNRLTELTIKSVAELEDCSSDVVWKENLSSLLCKVNDEHPDLKKIRAEIQAAEYTYGATMAENYPEITGSVGFNTSSDSYLLHRQWLNAGVGIEIPLFDGGIVQSKLLQQKDIQKELDLQYDAAYQDICLQVTNAFLSVDAAYGKIPVAQESIIQAEENLKIDRDLYQEGFLASDDLLNDEERLAEARSNYFQALYNFKRAQNELAYALGEIEL